MIWQISIFFIVLSRYLTLSFIDLTFLDFDTVPEGSYFCSTCSDTTQPTYVKSPWYSINHVKFQEIVDTTYTSDEEDENDYQSSESGEIDIDEPGTFFFSIFFMIFFQFLTILLINLEQIPIPEESSEEEDYANGESDNDEDEKEVRAYRKRKKKNSEVCEI